MPASTHPMPFAVLSRPLGTPPLSDTPPTSPRLDNSSPGIDLCAAWLPQAAVPLPLCAPRPPTPRERVLAQLPPAALGLSLSLFSLYGIYSSLEWPLPTPLPMATHLGALTCVLCLGVAVGLDRRTPRLSN